MYVDSLNNNIVIAPPSRDRLDCPPNIYDSIKQAFVEDILYCKERPDEEIWKENTLIDKNGLPFAISIVELTNAQYVEILLSNKNSNELDKNILDKKYPWTSLNYVWIRTIKDTRNDK